MSKFYTLFKERLTIVDDNYTSNQQAIFNIYPDGYPNYPDYCNFTLPLWMFYYTWSLLGIPVSVIHQNVPKTATVLESVPENFPSSWRTIESGQSVEYVAHERIILQPGFKVEAGAHFSARIEPCASCGNTSRSTLLSAQGEDTNDIYEFNSFNDTLHKSANNNLQEEVKDKEVTISPNPNNGTFTIFTNIDPQEIISVQVFSMLGQSIYRQSGLPNKIIQLPSSTSGVYYVEIITTTQRFIRKMVVQ